MHTRRQEAEAEVSYFEPGQREKIRLVAEKVAREAAEAAMVAYKRPMPRTEKDLQA